MNMFKAHGVLKIDEYNELEGVEPPALYAFSD